MKIKNILKNTKNNIQKHPIISGVIFLIIIAGTITSFFTSKEVKDEEANDNPRTVEIIEVSDFRSGALGISSPIAGGDSFVIRAESSGKITKVANLTEVSQGTIIAEIENSAQRAALLQAQGAYEGTLAMAEQSNIGAVDANTALTAAKNEAVNTNKSALTAWTSTMYNVVDQVFNKPLEKFPGVEIDAFGEAPQISRERGSLNETLKNWNQDAQRLNAGMTTAEIIIGIDSAITNTNRLSTLVNQFVLLLPRQKVDNPLPQEYITALQNSFASAQATLDAQKSALERAKTGLQRAEEGLKSAEISGTSGTISSANAQTKQALGSYQAARSAYEKTIVRAPFAGKISSVNVNMGDIVNYGSDVAIITPNEGESTEVSFLLPLSAVKYTPDGATVFVINQEGNLETIQVETGLVTASSIKITGLTGEEKIVKDIRGLRAGDKVEVN